MKSIDFSLLLPTATLISFSLIIHQSFSPHSFYLQLIHVIIGTIATAAIIYIDTRSLEAFKYPLYFLSLALLLATLILGTATHGSVRWLTISGFRFQPSEFVKPLLILSFASFLSHTDLSRLFNLIKLCLLFIIPVIFVFLQPDFGSAIILTCIIAAMIFVAGIRFLHQFIVLILGLLSSPLVWLYLKDYQKQRIFTFLNPLSDPLGKGYNSIQALIAVGSGRLFGRGLGHGTQSKLRFLPERQTDFVFASLAEELGFLGTSFILLLYCWLIFRLISLAGKHQSPFAFYSTIGIATMFAAQAFINLSINLGILPVTGITLPLISAGGSSIVSSLVCLGLASKLASQIKPVNHIEIT